MNGESQKLAVRERYDRTVNEYDRIRFGRLGGKYFDALEKSYVLRFLEPGKVLHVGTATGRFARLLPARGYGYVGIEISQLMARASRQSGNSDPEIVNGDGEVLPFVSGYFDNVLSVRSFHFLPNPRSFLLEAKRVLKPSGRVVVSFETFVAARPMMEGLRILPKPLPARATYRVQEVRKMFQQAGLDVVWSGKVTNLPLIVFFRSSGLPAKLIRRLHPYLPTILGTVGLVVGRPG